MHALHLQPASWGLRGQHTQRTQHRTLATVPVTPCTHSDTTLHTPLNQRMLTTPAGCDLYQTARDATTAREKSWAEACCTQGTPCTQEGEAHEAAPTQGPWHAPTHKHSKHQRIQIILAAYGGRQQTSSPAATRRWAQPNEQADRQACVRPGQEVAPATPRLGLLLLLPYAGAPGRPLGLLPRAAAAACLLLAMLRAIMRSASSCCWYHLRFWFSFSRAWRCTSSLK